ncbi:helix-turn-helix domain-containing protein [Nonlabens sp.]|uniref:helix-turn-helix domain-containing protein n=1 Tax=Nonlabens sp. TaxID=1888209 RepID=UPI003F69830E
MGSCKRDVISVLFLFSSLFVFGQEKVDSLNSFSNKELIDKFYENYPNSIKASVYANEYLTRAKKLKDTINIADGYYFKSLIANNVNHKKYNDSIILLTKDLKQENKYHPIIAYFNNGDQYYKEKKFDLALNSYLLALNSEINHSNQELFYEIKHRIGLLKSRYGEDEDALHLYLEVYRFYTNNAEKFNNQNNNLPIIFAVSDGYLRIGKIDSALFYVNQGKRESNILNDSVFENYFNFQKGLIDFKQGKYLQSVSKIENSLPLIKKLNDYGNIICGYYHQGESFLKTNNNSKAIEKFKAIDSLYQITKDIHPDYRKGYEHLIKHYDSTGNLKEELKYIRKLLDVDQNLNSNYKTVSKNLSESYDTPKLINQKDQIINEIESISRMKTIMIASSTVFLLGVLFYLIVSLRKKRRIEENFKKLLNESAQIVQPVHNENDFENEVKTINGNNRSEIPEEIIELIKNELIDFQKEKKFLDKNLKLTTMADLFNTNTKYLSGVLNQHMGISFSSYLSNLRVSFAIDKLKEDTKFRKYTIKAIAEESGFNSAESFSKSFHKKTGMRPSLFIKKLNKMSLDS